MAKSELNVTLRETTGKGAARQLRRQGFIPGVVYGREMDACPVSVGPKALEAAVTTEGGWNTLITLRGDGPFDGRVVVLKDLTVHPVRRDMIHADFHVIDMKKQVHANVPVNVIGTSEGQKIGGSLQLVRRELECVCLPTAIPSSIDIDVSDMMIGDVVHIDDIDLPPGVEVPRDVNFTILTIVGQRPEEEEGEEAEEEEGAAGEAAEE